LSRYYIVEYLHGFLVWSLFQGTETNSAFLPVAEIVAKSARLESTLNMAAIHPLDYPYQQCEVH
jgi:hypothetical protein